MNLAILRYALHGLRWQITWFGLGMAAYAAIVVWIYPSMAETLGQVEYPAELLQFFGAQGGFMGDPRVFVQVEYFSLAPVILVIYGIVAGTGLLAGDEGRGTLETVLAQPIARGTLYTTRALALAIGLLGISVLNATGWAISVPLVQMDGLGLATLTGATFTAIPMVLAFGGMSVFLAALSPTRGTAAGIMTALTIGSYLVASFAQAVEAVRWMQWVTPHFYSDANRVLNEGVVWWHQGVLLGIAVIAFALGWVAFNGREIAAGRWQPEAVMRG